ncbi:hypothetical protein Sgleb_26530 [Streptomyces glebosus]|uniref:Uncharacterized protein n=1 Tax=Streptomyces glebosus TaxID=249580 RepID=A0A640SX06_9ACTN|nr:hypothetical protein Sgleb_26530 [Streptomyces glebosus]GHG88631.1 hypothetical protein GCM10010513_70940 [Streptomyces glebosus]
MLDLIPLDPHFLPSLAATDGAQARLRQLAPEALGGHGVWSLPGTASSRRIQSASCPFVTPSPRN